MLTLPAAVRIYVAAEPMDLRRSFRPTRFDQQVRRLRPLQHDL